MTEVDTSTDAVEEVAAALVEQADTSDDPDGTWTMCGNGSLLSIAAALRALAAERDTERQQREALEAKVQELKYQTTRWEDVTKTYAAHWKERAEAAEARVCELEEAIHYSTGVAELAMKHRDAAEASVCELTAQLAAAEAATWRKAAQWLLSDDNIEYAEHCEKMALAAEEQG